MAAADPGQETQESAAAGTLDMWEAMQAATPPTSYHFTLSFVGRGVAALNRSFGYAFRPAPGGAAARTRRRPWRL